MGMKTHFLVTSVFVLGALLGGCLDDETAPVQEIESPYGPGSGSADAHGDPMVDEGEVDTAMSAFLWEARQDIVIYNDFGGASLSQVEAASQNGFVHVMPSDNGDYRVVIELSAYGMTPQQAQQRLESMTVVHADELAGDVLQLSTIVEFDDPDSMLPFLDGPGGGAHITYYLPRAPGHDLRLATSNGDIEILDLQGPAFTAETSNGDIFVSHVTVDSLSAGTANGDITLEGVADKVAAAASNGDILAAITSVHAGSYALATSNGDVVLAVNGSSDYGYDVRAGTGNGEIIVELEGVDDVEPATEGQRHVRTIDFDERRVKVNAEMAASNGDIVVTDDAVAMVQPHH